MTASDYRLEFSAAAARELRELDRPTAVRIRSATEALRKQPRPPGATALQANAATFRIRVGDYRIIYTMTTMCSSSSSPPLGHRQAVYHKR